MPRVTPWQVALRALTVKRNVSINYSSFLNADDAGRTPVPEERLILYQPLNDNDPSGKDVNN